MRPFASAQIARVFDGYPKNIGLRLLTLRELVFCAAGATEGVGELEETLKWGEPAYLTSKSKSGSTIRIGWKRARPGEYAMYFNCNTTLIESFKARFSKELQFDANRAIVFEESEPVPLHSLAICVAMALTYHRKSQIRP